MPGAYPSPDAACLHRWPLFPLQKGPRGAGALTCPGGPRFL